jgi:hypothetical protein
VFASPHPPTEKSLKNALCYFVVNDVSLSSKTLPYEGVVQVALDSGIKNVCWQSLNNQAYYVIFCQLGYESGYIFQNITNPVDTKDAIFSGSVNCNGREQYISQCSINMTHSGRCSELTYVNCKCTV